MSVALFIWLWGSNTKKIRVVAELPNMVMEENGEDEMARDSN